MARFYLTIALYLFSLKVPGQTIHIVPLAKNNISGPLGSTVYFFKEADTDTLLLTIPKTFLSFVNADSLQLKYYDFDQNKKIYKRYKSKEISFSNFKRDFMFPVSDTTFFENSNLDNIDDRIHLLMGKDKKGNVLFIIDENNNNKFDDKLYFINLVDYQNQKAQINKEIVLQNVNYVGLNGSKSYSFEVQINFKSPNNTVRKGTEKTLLSFEYSENYFSRTLVDNDTLDVFIRPIHPSPFFCKKNYLLYLYANDQRQKFLKSNNIPSKFFDTLSTNKNTYIIRGDSSDATNVFLEKLSYRKIDEYKIGDTIEIIATTISDKKVITDEFKGKPLLIDFWGTWCKPCLEDLPKIKKLNNEVGGNINFLSFIYDTNEHLKVANEIIAKHRVDWPQIFIPMEQGLSNNNYIKKFQVSTFPQYVIVSEKGVIVYKTNAITEAELFLKKNFR